MGKKNGASTILPQHRVYFYAFQLNWSVIKMKRKTNAKCSKEMNNERKKKKRIGDF